MNVKHLAIFLALLTTSTTITASCYSATPPVTPTVSTTDLDATPTPAPYDSNSTMFQIFAGYDLTLGFGPLNDRTIWAIDRVVEFEDTSMVRVLIETMRYLYSNEVVDAIVDALEALTGETSFGDDWGLWSEWVGRNIEDYPPPEEYGEWKINYLRRIDPRFSQFIRPALEGGSKVSLTEVEWGGVIPDGIPDLQNPPHVAAADAAADYLSDDERVVGVSINGEHRAYPLRIVNAHELVNDVLGGEPLALTW